MATGALEASGADIAVAITGVAGPGASEAKPEGRVHFACARRTGAVVNARCDFGPVGRNAIREASVRKALRMLIEAAID